MSDPIDVLDDEPCDHTDAYGSTLMPDRMCIVCDREIPVPEGDAQ